MCVTGKNVTGNVIDKIYSFARDIYMLQIFGQDVYKVFTNV